ncbi:phosphatase PAP2 family protein [Streptomyces sp. H27-D2]|uniref:phosphatase PAP2 family protein n=1 Tax=Streptomyces sp. H27-D2 TaxID=3046304 RepID=UPI002DB58698|nr:phosphatase PAP2 family protein [Streptomyces sp. H27-D2]MEC4019090.1 phosphatase PAP2 family protein [Streptomyces sp. H27-D2]
MQAPTLPSSAPTGSPSGSFVAYVRAGVLLTVLSTVLLVLVAVEWGPLLTADRWIAETLHRSAVESPGWVRANRVLSDWVWDPWTMRVLLAATALWLIRRDERWLAVWVVATAALGTALQQLLKAAVGRERPQWPDPVDSAHFAAFPSGHALTATVTAGLVIWLLRSHGVRGRWFHNAVAVAVVSVLGVGCTRLYLGVHWLSDVVAGWLLGLALVALAAAAFTRWGPGPGPGQPSRPAHPPTPCAPPDSDKPTLPGGK